MFLGVFGVNTLSNISKVSQIITSQIKIYCQMTRFLLFRASFISIGNALDCNLYSHLCLDGYFLGSMFHGGLVGEI